MGGSNNVSAKNEFEPIEGWKTGCKGYNLIAHFIKLS